MQRDGFSFGDFALVLWHQWMLVATMVVISILLGVLYLHSATYRYTITLQLAPVVTSASGNSNLGALGAIAGIDLNRENDPQSFKLFQAGLQSRTAAEALASDEGFMRRLYPEEWSQEESRWREPRSRIRPLLNKIRSALGFNLTPWQPPNASRLFEYLQTDILITQSRTSPVVTVELVHKDPQLAAEFLLRLNMAVDHIMRERALRRADGYISYITAQLQRVTISDYRAALVTNLSEQEKNRMMAAANVSFSSEVFGGPAASERPTSPVPVMVLAFAGALGLAAGAGLALLRELRRDRRSLRTGAIATGVTVKA